ncbi:MAG: hypothetical protein MJ000_03805 [Bacteroidales bacterium]|nr:hypothetical protein [Bacteroidales bacterium]
MKKIKYIKLFEYLRDTEELEGMQIFRTIFKVRNLPNEFLAEVEKIIEGKECSLEIDGISYGELVEKDGMKPIRAILFLDWLRTEPEAALAYMEEKAYMRAPIQPLSEDEKEELAEAIERLKKQVKVQPQPELEVDMSKNDIVIEELKEKCHTVEEKSKVYESYDRSIVEESESI